MHWKHHFTAFVQSDLKAVREQTLCKVFLYQSAGSVILEESGHVWHLVHITCRQIVICPLKLLGDVSALHLIFYSGHSGLKKKPNNKQL